MHDLIDRQTAITALIEDKIQTKIYITPTAERDFEVFNGACDRHAKILKELPSIPSEIIRCKDCKHRPILDVDGELDFPTYKCPCQCEDFYYSWMPKDDWFCGNGERREGRNEAN